MSIAARTLLVQRRDLLQLIGHGGPGRGSGLRRRRLLRRRGLLGLLLLHCADSLVLVGLVRGPLIRFAGLVLARYAGAAADHGAAHEWAASHEHHCLLLLD